MPASSLTRRAGRVATTLAAGIALVLAPGAATPFPAFGGKASGPQSIEDMQKSGELDLAPAQLTPQPTASLWASGHEVIVYGFAQPTIRRLLATEPDAHINPPPFHIIAGEAPDCTATVDVTIVCTSGMMQLIGDDQDAFAFIMAHELSHLILKHNDEITKQAKLKSEIATLSAVAGFTLLFAKSKYTRQGNTVNVLATQGASNAFLFSLAGGMYANRKVDTLIGPAWTRAQEDAADANGLKMMHAAGYDVSGSYGFMEKLTNGAAAYKAHEALFSQQVRSSALGVALLAGMLSKGDIKTIGIGFLGAGIDAWMDERGRETHHNTAERGARLREIVRLSHYNDQAGKQLKQLALIRQERKALADLQPMLEHAKREADLRDTMVLKTAADVAKGCTTPYGVNGERETCAVAFIALGRTREAKALVALVMADKRAPPRYFEELALAFAAVKDRAAAVSTLDSGSKLYADGRFYPNRMTIQHDLGDADGARKSGQECEAKASAPFKDTCRQLAQIYAQPQPGAG